MDSKTSLSPNVVKNLSSSGECVLHLTSGFALKYHEGLILMTVQRFKVIVVVIITLPVIYNPDRDIVV